MTLTRNTFKFSFVEVTVWSNAFHNSSTISCCQIHFDNQLISLETFPSHRILFFLYLFSCDSKSQTSKCDSHDSEKVKKVAAQRGLFGLFCPSIWLT